MPYAIRRNILVLIVVMFGCTLAACGKKGPLYLPDQPRKSTKKAPVGGTPSQPQSPQTGTSDNPP